ncbi:PH domain-containing protein [Candidatus Albibeggiatoa sp. nov. NOAA]|uniref:PH domain-containing protein n=1 Tax=Candidatus Albibeggiatoa sp. nov. NOAA TaxID=3162724 RepID=UPI0032FD15B6|nr:PH domain-containing protein [Thiotrichaceae bacterium]
MDEKTLFSAHPAMFKYKPISFSACKLMALAGLILPLVLEDFSWILGGILFAIGASCLLFWWISTLFITLTITEKRTILQKGFFSRHISEVFHTNIRSIEIEQTLIQRLFNTGTIRLASAASSGFEIEVAGIKEPLILKKMINDCRRVGHADNDMNPNTQGDD